MAFLTATCSGPQGPFSHIFVTITDVQINASASAGDNDPNWIDLTPNLQQSPQQVDLLGQANNQCFLAMLGSSIELQPGSYQQIRIVLAGDATATDPVCSLAPLRFKVDAILASVNEPAAGSFVKPDWLYRPNPA